MKNEKLFYFVLFAVVVVVVNGVGVGIAFV